MSAWTQLLFVIMLMPFLVGETAPHRNFLASGDSAEEGSCGIGQDVECVAKQCSPDVVQQLADASHPDSPQSDSKTSIDWWKVTADGLRAAGEILGWMKEIDEIPVFGEATSFITSILDMTMGKQYAGCPTDPGQYGKCLFEQVASYVKEFVSIEMEDAHYQALQGKISAAEAMAGSVKEELVPLAEKVNCSYRYADYCIGGDSSFPVGTSNEEEYVKNLCTANNWCTGYNCDRKSGWCWLGNESKSCPTFGNPVAIKTNQTFCSDRWNALISSQHVQTTVVYDVWFKLHTLGLQMRENLMNDTSLFAMPVEQAPATPAFAVIYGTLYFQMALMQLAGDPHYHSSIERDLYVERISELSQRITNHTATSRQLRMNQMYYSTCNEVDNQAHDCLYYYFAHDNNMVMQPHCTWSVIQLKSCAYCNPNMCSDDDAESIVTSCFAQHKEWVSSNAGHFWNLTTNLVAGWSALADIANSMKFPTALI